MPNLKAPLRRSAGAAAVTVAVVGVALAAPARAADLDSSYFDAPPPAQVQPVEFGTGWYIRGDLAYVNDSLPPLSPDLSYLSSSRTSSFGADLGFGYKFTNWFRVDFTGEYLKSVTAGGRGAGRTCTTQVTTINNIPTVTATDFCTPNYTSSVRRWDFLANGYVDIGTWYGFTPYVGAGAGFSLTRTNVASAWYMSNGVPYQVTTDGFYFNYNQSYSTTRYQFAWALMGGVAYAITPQIILDLGYRYLNLGTLPGIANASGQIITQRMDAHEVRIGLRYMID